MCAVLPIQLSMFLQETGAINDKQKDYVLVFDVEVDVQSVQQFGLQVCEQILSHCHVLVSAIIRYLRLRVGRDLFIESLFAYLYPS